MGHIGVIRMIYYKLHIFYEVGMPCSFISHIHS